MTDFQEAESYNKFRDSLGRPPPYRDQREAEAKLSMNELCRQMDIHREATDLTRKYRIQLNIDHREYLVSVLLKAMKEADQGKEKHVTLTLIFSICN